MAKRPVVVVCDTQLNQLDELSTWNSLDMVHRICDVGGGKLDVTNPTRRDQQLLHEGARIQIHYGGEVLQTGYLKQVSESRDAEVINKPSWWDPNILLFNEYAYPNPAPIPGQEDSQAGQGPNEFDLRSGYVTSVVMGLVNENIGPDAIAWRRAPGLTMGNDPLSGPVLSAPLASRWQNLLEQAASVSIPNGVAFGFHTSGRSLVFEANPIADRADRVVFTHAGGDVTIDAPKATQILVLGPYEGTARMVFIVRTAESMAQEERWGRPFIDVLDSASIVKADESVYASFTQWVADSEAAEDYWIDQAKVTDADVKKKNQDASHRLAEVTDANEAVRTADMAKAKAAVDLDIAEREYAADPTDANHAKLATAHTNLDNATATYNTRWTEALASRVLVVEAVNALAPAGLAAATAAQNAEDAKATTIAAKAALEVAIAEADRANTYATLYAEAERKLIEKAEVVNANFELRGDIWEPFKDYYLGDLVGVRVPGWVDPFVLPVIQITDSWTVAGGRTVTPLVGNYANSDTQDAITIRELRRKVAEFQSRR